MPGVAVRPRTVDEEQQLTAAHIRHDAGQGGAPGMEVMYRGAVNGDVFRWHAWPVSVPRVSRLRLPTQPGLPEGAHDVKERAGVHAYDSPAVRLRTTPRNVARRRAG